MIREMCLECHVVTIFKHMIGQITPPRNNVVELKISFDATLKRTDTGFMHALLDKTTFYARQPRRQDNLKVNAGPSV